MHKNISCNILIFAYKEKESWLVLSKLGQKRLEKVWMYYLCLSIWEMEETWEK